MYASKGLPKIMHLQIDLGMEKSKNEHLFALTILIRPMLTRLMKDLICVSFRDGSLKPRKLSCIFKVNNEGSKAITSRY